MNIYVITIFIALLIVSVLYNVLAQRVRTLAREHNELVALLFHQVRDLLTSIRWHLELLGSEGFTLQGKQDELLKRINDGIDHALMIHRTFLVTFGKKDKQQSVFQRIDEGESKNLTFLTKHDLANVTLAFHELLDLLTAVKWQTESLASLDHSKADSPQKALLAKIDTNVDDIIRLLDRFLRISANQKNLTHAADAKILRTSLSSFLSADQKDLLELPS